MPVTKTYSRKDVAQFNGKDGKPVWMIYRGAVYDFTSYLDKHPGGRKVMLEYAGRDCTKDFESMGHTADALTAMKPYKLGEIHEDENHPKLPPNGSFVSIMSTDSDRKKKRRFLLCR